MKIKLMTLLCSIGLLSFGGLNAGCCGDSYDDCGVSNSGSYDCCSYDCGYDDCCYDDCCCGLFGDGSFYVNLLVGANFLDVKKRDDFKFDFKTGYYIGGALGYKLNECFRLEGEIVYRHNKFKDVKYQDTRVDLGGHVRSVSFIANVFYDIDLCQPCFPVTPYIGAGIGYQTGEGKITFNDASVKGKEDGFVYQFIAGLGYDFCCGDWNLALEYRFLGGKHSTYDHGVGLSLKKYF